jgi:hypothetical protein
MKKLFTNENRLIVFNLKNVLQGEGIETLVVNEYAGGGAGDLPTFDTWPELWLEDETQFEQADAILQGILHGGENNYWYCKGCQEKNDQSFRLCWSCGRSYE